MNRWFVGGVHIHLAIGTVRQVERSKRETKGALLRLYSLPGTTGNARKRHPVSCPYPVLIRRLRPQLV